MPRKHTPKPKASARKPCHYPSATKGSRMAAKLRKQANELTDKEREAFFQAGMSIIYGSQQTAGARH